MSDSRVTVRNFGGNRTFQPALVVTPRSEEELLEVLAAQRGRKIRAVGRLHSWSEAACTDEVLVDLRHFQKVHVEADGEGWRATIGAGCQIKRILSQLDAHGLTLPSLGLISEQAIAGATATGTHGSGKNSLSHYLSAVRLAGYDPQTGEPMVRTIRDGDLLRAARCGLGTLGIITAVELAPRPAYQVREWLVFHRSLDAVLAAESASPLQQFFYLPWRWDYLVQHRQETNDKRSWFAPLYRGYWFTIIDVGLHLVIKALVQGLGGRGIKAFFRYVAPLTVIRRWRVVDRSQDMLIMEHELFRHIEIELFVTRDQLTAALSFVREVIELLDGRSDALSSATLTRLAECGMLDEFHAACGVYRHHYPICVRRVRADDTLLSMSSGGEQDWYALSFISYARPTRREGFDRFAQLLSDAMIRMFGARPHWGKVAPLTRDDVDRLYPAAERFRQIRHECDPHGTFLNRWTASLFGISGRESS